MTRRVLLGTGVVVAGSAALLGGAQAAGRLDDLADAVGLEPRPESDPVDDRLLRRAATEAAVLVAMVRAVAATQPTLALAPFEAAARAQMRAVGGSDANTDVAGPPGGAAAAVEQLVTAFRAASRRRATDAQRSFSPALTRVLASMSAGLAQGAAALEDLR